MAHRSLQCQPGMGRTSIRELIMETWPRLKMSIVSPIFILLCSQYVGMRYRLIEFDRSAIEKMLIWIIFL